MDLDALLTHYFGSTDLESLAPAALADGLEHLRTDFGVERDDGRKFALWLLLHAFGQAPDPDKVFKDPAVAQAARDYGWSASNAADKLE